MKRRTLLQSALLGFGSRRASPQTPKRDPLSWEAVMARSWQRPRKLDSFSKIHPRLFLSNARIASLKGRLEGSHKEVWEVVRARADAYLGRTTPSNFKSQGDMREAGRGIPWQALAYLMTGHARYLEGARRWMLTICEFPHWENDRSLAGGECLFGVAIGYDWLHDRLDAKEKSFIRDKLVRQARIMKDGPPVHHDRWLANHNHVEHLGLAAAGLALYHEIPEAIAWIRQADLVFRALLEIAGPDGGSTEGHQYWAYTTEALLRYAEMARDLLDTNLYGSAWLKAVPDFVIHSTLPGFNAENCVMSFGDSHREYASHGPTHILYRLAGEYRNGYAQWLANEMERRAVGRDAFCTWANLLWFDETLDARSVSGLPLFRHCDDVGWITARSSWNDDAVMMGFKCGPMHGHKAQRYYDANRGAAHEIGGGHGHPDVNSFQIFAYGKWLAIDPGYERPKWTRTHNCVLVNGRGQIGEGQTWFDRDAVLGAGASSAIVKADHTPVRDYIVGDARNIYPAGAGLKKYLRHVLFVRPDVFVVVDDLRADPAATFEWLLHTDVAIDRQTGSHGVVRNGDVLMDVHLVAPETIVLNIDGKTLRAAIGKSPEAVIVAVLHPRKASQPACSAEVRSRKGSRLEIAVEAGKRRIRVDLDLSGQTISVSG